MTEKFITAVCAKLENNIYRCISIPAAYKEKILPVPNLIKRQALECMKELEDHSSLLFYLTGRWSNELIDYMKEVNTEFNKLSSEERYQLAALQLAPFQLSLFASRTSSIPGLVKKYEAFKEGMDI